MKNPISNILLLGGFLLCASWGYKGHRTVALIATNHLTPAVNQNVKNLLAGESIADASTWADEIKNKTTGTWHYLNMPDGLNHAQFEQKLKGLKEENLYTAILSTEASVGDVSLSLSKRKEALKYLIHLVGDAHQPMHVSREEDKGGNDIQVRFDDKGTNLHSLWDSKLIDHEGLDETNMQKSYDDAPQSDIVSWQKDGPVEWLWESYVISQELYKQTKPGKKIDEVYYQKYIAVIHRRIAQAGIRLAGELNRLLKGQTINQQPAETTVQDKAEEVKLEDVKNYVGKTISTKGKVYSTKDIGSMILVNLGAAFPNQLLTIALKGDAKKLADGIEGKVISVQGTVIDYKGKPEIIISNTANVTVEK